jgi:tRNA(Ile)-lysidine synthase TilS/MesJ
MLHPAEAMPDPDDVMSPEESLQALVGKRLAALQPVRRWVLAFSGGRDSTVLIDLLRALRPGDAMLLAVHVDHGLHPESAIWAEHCRTRVGRLGIGFESLRVKVDRGTGEGMEAAARRAQEARLRAAIDAFQSVCDQSRAEELLRANLISGVTLGEGE